MDRLNNKGFTLVELIATIVILSLVIGITSFSITTIIKRSKEKDYNLLINEIGNAVELYYQECKYVNDNCDNEITLGYLVTNGYLKGNSSNEDKYTIVNPNDGENIYDCEISYKYENGKFNIEAVNPTGSCPISY